MRPDPRLHAAHPAGHAPGIRFEVSIHGERPPVGQQAPTWTLPGDNTVSGTDAVVRHAQKIAGYGLDFELLHVLVSRENVALSLHNTARRDDAVLDEYLSTVCRLRDGKITDIETYLSDVPGMNAFFV
ncbi:hypothetical protein [Actinoallomurus acaciae]|uniref:SnoaL-like domain-containing protein n=1 Tax=Actinoallomurus acaciae TaxID=502577 RepID=A0ABV5YMJ9_9ACTN